MKTAQLFFIPVLFSGLLAFGAPTKPPVAKGIQPARIYQTSPFATFRTHRQGKGITAVWSVATADQIVGFTVQRTYEDASDPYAYWENLSTVPFNPSRSFTYRDLDVFPGVITYRIVALFSDGSSAASPLSAVRIVSHK